MFAHTPKKEKFILGLSLSLLLAAGLIMGVKAVTIDAAILNTQQVIKRITLSNNFSLAAEDILLDLNYDALGSMYIKNKLGIGTKTPSGALDVSGSIYANEFCNQGGTCTNISDLISGEVTVSAGGDGYLISATLNPSTYQLNFDMSGHNDFYADLSDLTNVATQTTKGFMSAADKTKLDGLGGGGDYTLPTATTTTLGGIKVGGNLSISDGVLFATDTSAITQCNTNEFLDGNGDCLTVDMHDTNEIQTLTVTGNAGVGSYNISLSDSNNVNITTDEDEYRDDLLNGSGIYINYKPNDQECNNNQTLKWEFQTKGRVCGEVVPTDYVDRSTNQEIGGEKSFVDQIRVQHDTAEYRYLSIEYIPNSTDYAEFRFPYVAQGSPYIGFYFGTGTTPILKIDPTGVSVDGDITADAFIYSSDRRLKTNLEELDSALDHIRNLNAYYFDWINDGTPSMGFIAQQVAEEYPLVVHEKADGYLGIDYSSMTVPLLQAVKELDAENQKLKVELADLNKRLEALEQASR